MTLSHSAAGEGGTRSFWVVVLFWVAVPVGTSLIHQILAGSPPGEAWGPWDIVALLAAWIGIFIPFACFAGGLTFTNLDSLRALMLKSVVAAVASYSLMAYGYPLANETAQASHGIVGSASLPLGAETPSTLRALRAKVKADPPDQFSFRIERLADRPPNWLTYLIHSRYALALFAILAALLGQRAGFLTSGLPPPIRWNVRWTLGLVTAVLFFVAESGGGSWVRQGTNNSALLGAWIPLGVPLLELFLLQALVQRKQRRSRVSVRSGV